MKKLIYLLVFFVGILGISRAIAAFWPSGVTNFVISSPTTTSATFDWKTYDKPEDTKVDIWPSGTTKSASGTNFITSTCPKDNNSTVHCITFGNLISGGSYNYEITTFNSPKAGYTDGSFVVGIKKEPQKDIAFEITASDSTQKPIRKGQSATYEFEFANTGNFDDSYSIVAEESSPLISTSLTATSVAEIRPGRYSGKLRLTVTANSDSSSDQNVSGDIRITSNGGATPVLIPFAARVLAAVAEATPPPPPSPTPSPSTTPPPPPSTQTSTQTSIQKSGTNTNTSTNTNQSSSTTNTTTDTTTSTNTNTTTKTETPSTGPVLLQGKVVFPNGTPASGALISIWATNATTYATAGSNGEFSFQVVRNTTWRLSATRTVGTTGYKSNDITVTVGNATVADVSISLAAIPALVPPPTVTQKSVTERITTTLTNGASVDIPPSSVSASGNVTLDVRPTVEAHEYFTSQVVGLAYDIVIRDSAGTEVKTFVTPIDLVFPYDDATLISLGVIADNLSPSFYNETLKQWVPITTFTIDRVNKRVIAKVSHLTRFALIAAADVTAPSSPTFVTATKTSAGVVIRWVNPTADFRHAKIYRSTESGKLGTVLFGEVAGTSQTDTTAVAGVKYYYVVRSVDPAGNESANTDQVTVGASVSTSGSSGAVSTSGPTGLRRHLRVGMSGADVKIIQQIMVREGVYIEGFTTGYFGRLTQKAVIKLQEKYRAEILTPVGLTHGNGYAGPKTIQKLIELKAKYSL